RPVFTLFTEQCLIGRPGVWYRAGSGGSDSVTQLSLLSPHDCLFSVAYTRSRQQARPRRHILGVVLRIRSVAPTRTGVVLGEGRTWGASRPKYGTPFGGLLDSSPKGQRLRLDFFSLYPLADIGRAVHEGGTLRFALRQKLHGLAIHQLDLVQIQHKADPVCFQGEEALQLCHLFPLDAPTKGKDDELPGCRSLNSQHHLRFLDTTSLSCRGARRRPVVNH